MQQVLAEGTDLACTTGSGILPQCESAAMAWARIDGRPGNGMSQLAVTSIRALVRTQLNAILVATGKRRWCDVVTATTSAAQTFLQIVPSARFVCVHRACTGVIAAALEAHPWGLTSPAILPFAARYPGNGVAAVAAYWVSAADRLLAFEAAHPQATLQVRYEFVLADEHGMSSLRSALGLQEQVDSLRTPPDRSARRGEEQPTVPVDMIPEELRDRIDGLHGRLGYPALRLEDGTVAGSLRRP